MKSGAAHRQHEQRARILQAAARFIAERGYHGMSMRRLADASQSSLSNLYNYFASKEEILYALQREAFQTLIASTEEALAEVPDPAGRLYVFISHHVHYFAQHPEVMRVLVHEAASLPADERATVRALKERYFAIGREIVGQLVTGGCGRIGADGRSVEDVAEVDRITYSLFGMLNWIYGWYEPERHGSPEEVARTIHQMALCGLVSACPFRDLQQNMERHLATVESPPLLGAVDEPRSDELS